VKPSKILTATGKKKCCRSKPRCKRCPVVISSLRKAHAAGARGGELKDVYKRARHN
jgi:hypothetical protein